MGAGSERSREHEQEPDLHAQIEALQRENERLRLLATRDRGLIHAVLDQSPHGIIVCEASGQLVLHNRAAERIWAGSASANTVADWHKYRGFHPDGRPFAPEDWPMTRCLQERAVIDSFEVRIQRFDGTMGVLLSGCAPIIGDQDQLLGAVSVFVDVTAAKQIEEERERLTAELREIGVFREKFIAIVAHDLLNPLNAIAVGTRYLLTGGDLSESHAATIKRIARSGDRMTRMINDLTDFTAGRLGGGVHIATALMDMADVCRRSVEELRAASGRNIGFEARGELRGTWDPDRVAQAVTNLMSNALRHGADPITVSLDGQPDAVLMRVVNHGPAIPPEQLRVIFQPFKRATGEEADGLGLGLFIVQEILRAHSGSIDVVSSAADGTVFSASWPRVRVVPALQP